MEISFRKLSDLRDNFEIVKEEQTLRNLEEERRNSLRRNGYVIDFGYDFHNEGSDYQVFRYRDIADYGNEAQPVLIDDIEQAMSNSGYAAITLAGSDHQRHLGVIRDAVIDNVIPELQKAGYSLVRADEEESEPETGITNFLNITIQ